MDVQLSSAFQSSQRQEMERIKGFENVLVGQITSTIKMSGRSVAGSCDLYMRFQQEVFPRTDERGSVAGKQSSGFRRCPLR
ncbi:hypothetical protein ATW55_14985 [Ferroacidibacillus organovorans]|uniref:Uncharacterized protein n=1 Tax=Ferroacidibacillus organovorans TaxID=1765683 RepID=A0A101XQS4_9BACL|nr:hypothetical protein ATW55_14985 [Ferroacidibacillus organovorans]